MADGKIGVWFIGAWGGVSTTAATGLAALQQGLADEAGLVSGLPRFADLNLVDWNHFVIGGHEIRRTCYAVEAKNLYDNSRVFSPQLLEKISSTLGEFDRSVRTGTLINVGTTIESLASAETLKTKGERPQTGFLLLRDRRRRKPVFGCRETFGNRAENQVLFFRLCTLY